MPFPNSIPLSPPLDIIAYQIIILFKIFKVLIAVA